MPGFSITTLLLPTGSESGAPESSLLLSLLDEPANVPGWKWASSVAPPATVTSAAKKATGAGAVEDVVALRAEDPKAFDAAVERAELGREGGVLRSVRLLFVLRNQGEAW